jgi:ubiquinone/menaquinone biosynthesis C-methylase UbiE
MSKSGDKISVPGVHTCPWWLCFTFDNPVRAMIHNPVKILHPYVKEGDSVLDIGPGMGYFTIPLSTLVGRDGSVVALDIQEGMLKRLRKRVEKKNILNIEAHLYDGTKFNLKKKFDFVLLFWMLHEVREKKNFVREIASVLEKDAKILIVEPHIHVTKKNFEESVSFFQEAGMRIVETPKVALSGTALLAAAK